MAAAPTWQDFYDIGRAEAVLRRPSLTFNQGDVTDMFMAAAAAMADRLTGYAADRFRATYLDGAKGDDLTILCTDHWNINRFAAVKAVGQVTLSRVSFSFGAFTYPAGSIVATQKDALGNDVQFTTDTDAIFGPTALSVTVNATAVGAGTSGNVATGTVTQLITPPLDNTLTCTNAFVMAGGAEAESDDSLRERTRGFPATLRRGTLDALEYGALTVAGVAVAHAVEDASGITTVYVADVDGNSNNTLVTNVQLELENWRAAGSLVDVTGGVLISGTGTNGAGRLIVTLQLTVRTGVNIQALISSIQAAVVNRLSKLRPGETLYRAQIHQAVINVAPDDIVNVTVIDPAADLQPPAGTIIRTTTADVSVS